MSTDQCNYSGLLITHPEAFVCSTPESGFHADIAKLGNNIMFVKSYGYVISSAESELQAFFDDFISRYFNDEKGIIYIEDYADITGGDVESRKKYISYFKNNHIFIAVILYNLPPIYKISFNLTKKLNIYASRAHAVNTYEQAVALALKLADQNNPSYNKGHDKTILPPDIVNQPFHIAAGSRVSGVVARFFEKLKSMNIFFTKKTKQQLTDQYSEELLKYIASIDWQKPGIQPLEKILHDDVSSKKVFDAISFIKSEIDMLMAERAESEAILQESEAKYRLLVEHAKAGFLEYDYITNRLTHVNDEFVHMTGYSEQELLGKAPIDLLTKESQKIFSKRMSKIFSGEPISSDIIYQSVTKNNDIRWWLINPNVTFQDNRPIKGSAVISDITTLKLTENKLLEYQEELKRLSIRQSMVEEGQRRSMASHLHETIGQELFVLLLQFNALEKSIDNPALVPPLKQARGQLLKIIKETKNLTFDLSPPVLYDFGFQEAITTLADTIKVKHNIEVRTNFEGEMDTFEDEIKVIIYRNLKELVHNTIKHADAQNITISFKNSESRLWVQLSDDGVGFDAANYKSKTSSHEGFGLFDINEKLNHLGGSLIIDSAPGKGTSISMQVPLKRQN